MADCGQTADEWHRQQEAEHGQARHGLHDVREADERRGQTGAPGGEDAERQPDGDRDEGRNGDEQHVLRQQHRQLPAMRNPERQQATHRVLSNTTFNASLDRLGMP